MRRQIVRPACWLAILSLGAGAIVHAQNDSGAVALLRQARKALGGEARLKSVRSLSGFGEFRRMVGEQQVSADVEIHFQLPDKFLRTETMDLPDGSSAVIEAGFNGAELLRGSKAAGGMRIADPTNSPDAGAHALEFQRAEFARLLIGLLLAASPSFPVNFAYDRDATASDGTADVLDGRGPNDFAFRLFLDKKSHRPVMLTYFMEADSQRKAEVRMLFDDYRAVGGIQLPHLLSRSVDGGPFEEWAVERFKLNPSIDPAQFQKK